MDSEWFAVDDDGHVALFVTHETGPMPADDAFTLQARSEDDFEPGMPMIAILAARLPRRRLVEVFERHPDWAFEVCMAIVDDPDLLRWLGVYVYAPELHDGGPYVRRAAALPLGFEAVAEPFRGRLERARLPVRFANARCIAVPALVAARTWGGWTDLDGAHHDGDVGVPPGMRAVEPGGPERAPELDAEAAMARLRAIVERTCPETTPPSVLAVVQRWLR